MRRFSDEEMQTLLPTARQYSVVLMKAGPEFGTDESREHGRRNFGYGTRDRSRWCAG